jgi:hypothetical protein
MLRRARSSRPQVLNMFIRRLASDQSASRAAPKARVAVGRRDRRVHSIPGGNSAPDWWRGPPLGSFRYGLKVSKVLFRSSDRARSAAVVNALVRMLTVICACAGGLAVAAGSDPNAVEPDQSVSQPSAPAPAGATGAPSATPESRPASTTPAETTPSHLPPAKAGSDAAPTPTSANKPTKIVLRDETLDGAQLKQGDHPPRFQRFVPF